jgi:hypothetical protein
VNDSPSTTDPPAHRSPDDRRNADTRAPGVWTDAERDRFRAAIRESGRHPGAAALNGGAEGLRADHRHSRRVVHVVHSCVVCGATQIDATAVGGIITVVCSACGATFEIEYDPPHQPDVRVRFAFIRGGDKRG